MIGTVDMMDKYDREIDRYDNLEMYNLTSLLQVSGLFYTPYRSNITGSIFDAFSEHSFGWH